MKTSQNMNEPEIATQFIPIISPSPHHPVFVTEHYSSRCHAQLFFWREREQKRQCDVIDAPIIPHPPIINFLYYVVSRFFVFFGLRLFVKRGQDIKNYKFETPNEAESTNSFLFGIFWNHITLVIARWNSFFYRIYLRRRSWVGIRTRTK